MWKALSGKTILTVDDDQSQHDILNSLLQEQYDVRNALSGEEGIEIANSDSPPNLILLDVMMPELDGLDVCRQLKASENTAEIPIIFLTGNTDTTDIVNGFRVGGADYIAKPVEPEELMARVRSQLKIQQYLHEINEMKSKLEESNDAKSQVISMVTQQVIPFSMLVLKTSMELKRGGLDTHHQAGILELASEGKIILNLARKVEALMK